MSLCALLSGLALANGKLGAAHGIAGPLGGYIGAPHGAITAAVMVEVCEFNIAHGDTLTDPAHWDDEPFEAIVSNPPYVVAGDPHLEQDGLPFEPYTALSDGRLGGDGADCIRALIAGAGAHLRPGGRLLIEHGYDQAVIVRELLCAAGFTAVASWHDGAAIERVSGGSWA